MHRFASYNQEILPVSEPNIKAFSSAALYGRGVFTTLAIYHSKPFLWEKHWQRLEDNARRLEIDLSAHPENDVRHSLEVLIEKNKISDGRCRITIFDESAGKIWPSGSEAKTSRMIQTAGWRERKREILLTVSSFGINSASPLAGIKTCNYLENLLAFEAARSGGFDEAVRLNERGEITSACLANIFWQKDGELFTPDLKTGCLKGTIREFIMEGRTVFEVRETPEVLHQADAVYLTSSGLGIVRAANFGERKFSSVADDLTFLLPFG
jgi:branched-subunit amino acid aminotransferase/4-amino-4-deoxychorismate lyase